MPDPHTSIRAVIDCPHGGRIVTMGFPGLTKAVDGAAYIDPDASAATLADPSLAGFPVLIALIEEQEAPEDALGALDRVLSARGAALKHLPIIDYAAPSPAFEARWVDEGPRCQQLLDDGRTIGVTCHYGAGRSGTIAARLLIDRGLRPEDAIKTVRAAFAESIESPAQHDWLTNLG